MADEIEDRKLNDEKIKETVERLFDYRKNLTVQILNRVWFRNILYYMGEQWFEWAKSQATFKRIMPSPYTPTPTSNIIRDFVRSIKALILNKDFTVSIWPNSNDRDDREAAEMGENFLRWLETDNDEVYLDEKEKLAIWTIICGTTFDRTFPDMEDDSWVFDASGNPISKGNIMSEGLSPFNVTLDHYGNRLRQKRCVGIKSLKPREWVEDTFHIKINATKTESGDMIDYEKKLSHMVANVSPWKGDGLQVAEDWQDTEDMVLFKEVEWRPTQWHPQGFYAAMVGDEIAFKHERLPIPVSDDGKWEYSITDYHYYFVPGRFWSDSGVNDLISPQNSINQIDQDLETNRKGLGRPIVLLSADVNMKKITKYGQSVLVLQYDGFLSGGVKPEIGRGTPLPNQVLEERNIHRGQAQDAGGDPKNVLRGKAPSSQASGIMVDILRDAAEQGHMPDVHRFYRAMKRTKRKQLILAQELYSEERMIKIPDKDNRVKVVAFKGADLRNNTDVRFELSSGIASTRAGQTQMILNLTKEGFFNVDNPLEPEYRQELLSRMGLSGFKDSRNVDMERAQDENEIMANFDPEDLEEVPVKIPKSDENPEGAILAIPIIPGIFLSMGDPSGNGEGMVISDDPLFKYDDQSMHYETHRRFILSNEFKYLDEAIQDVAIAHTDLHKGAMELQALEAQQKMGQAAAMIEGEPEGGTPE